MGDAKKLRRSLATASCHADLFLDLPTTTSRTDQNSLRLRLRHAWASLEFRGRRWQGSRRDEAVSCSIVALAIRPCGEITWVTLSLPSPSRVVPRSIQFAIVSTLDVNSRVRLDVA